MRKMYIITNSIAKEIEESATLGLNFNFTLVYFMT